MSNQTTGHLFLYPDPFGDGQAVAIEATDREDADKQLSKLQDKHDKAQEANDTPQELPQEAVEPKEKETD